MGREEGRAVERSCEGVEGREPWGVAVRDMGVLGALCREWSAYAAEDEG